MAAGVGLTGSLLIVLGCGGAFETATTDEVMTLIIPTAIGSANVYRANHLPRAGDSAQMAA